MTSHDRGEELKAQLESDALKAQADALVEQLKATSRALKEASAEISDQVDRKLGR